MNIDNESTFMQVRQIGDNWRLDKDFGDDLVWRDLFEERCKVLKKEARSYARQDFVLSFFAGITYINIFLSIPITLVVSHGNIIHALLIGFIPYLIWVFYLWRKERFDDFLWFTPAIPFMGIIPFIFLGAPWLSIVLASYLTGIRN